MTDPDPAGAPRESLTAYLLMRTDLPSLGLGKSRAQAMHAGNAMTMRLLVQPMLDGAQPDERALRWHREAEGFGTTLAIGARGQVPLAVIDKVVDAAGKLGIHAGRIVDDSYPYAVDDEVYALIAPAHHTLPATRIRDGWRCFRRETTGAWLFGDRGELDVLLARFDLTPHHEDERGRS